MKINDVTVVVAYWQRRTSTHLLKITEVIN